MFWICRENEAVALCVCLQYDSVGGYPPGEYGAFYHGTRASVTIDIDIDEDILAEGARKVSEMMDKK